MELLAIGAVCILLGFVLLLACGALYTFYAVKTAERRYPPRGRFFDINGQKIHYLDTGGIGRPVVWIHGAHASMFDFLLAFGEPLNDTLKTKYRFIYIDRPGFGHSTRVRDKPLTIFEQAEILHEAVTRIGIKKPFLAGHSFGAAVAMAYAQNYQEEVAGLLLLAPYLHPYDGAVNPIHYIPVKPLIGSLFMDTLFLPVVRAFFTGNFLDKVFSPDPAPVEYAEKIRSMALRPDNYRSNACDIRLFGPALHLLAENYTSLRLPVVAVHGKDDLISPHREHILFIERNLLSLRHFFTLKKTGHHPLFTQGAAVLSALEALCYPELHVLRPQAKP